MWCDLATSMSGIDRMCYSASQYATGQAAQYNVSRSKVCISDLQIVL